MNEPNKPAEGIMPPAKPETMPPLWWLKPWTFAVQQWNARALYYKYWQVAEEQREIANAEASAKTLRIKVTEQNIVDTANAAGFEASKAGYYINGQPRSPFPLKWLGEAVAYWKGEAYAARKQRDDAKADKAEAEKHHAEEHAANVRLQQELNNACEQANKAGDDIEKLAAKCLELEQKVMDLEAKWPRDLWHGGKIHGDVYTCDPHAKPAKLVGVDSIIYDTRKSKDQPIQELGRAKPKRKPAKKKGGKR